jgi:hypothetical protein
LKILLFIPPPKKKIKYVNQCDFRGEMIKEKKKGGTVKEKGKKMKERRVLKGKICFFKRNKYRQNGFLASKYWHSVRGGKI